MPKKETDDVEIEFEEDVVAEVTTKDRHKKLKEDLRKAKEEAKTNLDGWQRSRADYVNLQKQLDAERGQIRKRAVEGIILELLPTLDNFEMAMKNKEVWESVDQGWRTGIEYIYSQLQKTLTEHGAEEINDPSVDFDPTIHEPLETIETDTKKDDGKIIEIMQKGYRLNGNIIRPAKVKIYKSKQ